MSVLIEIRCIVFLSFFIAANGAIWISGFNKNKWNQIGNNPNEYKYYFYDGEILNLDCNDDHNMKINEKLGWEWKEDDYGGYRKRRVPFYNTIRLKDDGTYLTCSHNTTCYIRTQLIWDHTQKKNIIDDVTVAGFEEERWLYVDATIVTSQSDTFKYNYYFYDGESLNLECKKNKPNTNGLIGWGLNDEDLSKNEAISLDMQLKALHHHNTLLYCTYKTENGTYRVINTTLLWDANHPKNHDGATIAGFDKDRWKHIDTYKYKYNIITKYTYDAYDGEPLNLTCQKINTAATGTIGWAYVEEYRNEYLYPNNKKLSQYIQFDPSHHHLKYVACRYDTPTQTIIIDSLLFWDIRNRNNSKSPYFTFDGFERGRLDNTNSEVNNYTYYFKHDERLNLTCKRAYLLPGYTQWTYDGSLNIWDYDYATSRVDIKMDISHNNTNLTCNYMMYIMDYGSSQSVAAYVINLQQCTESIKACKSEQATSPAQNPNTSPSTESEKHEDPSDAKYECNKKFYFTGLPSDLQLSWSSENNKKDCTTTLQYNKLLNLKLTCTWDEEKLVNRNGFTDLEMSIKVNGINTVIGSTPIDRESAHHYVTGTVDLHESQSITEIICSRMKQVKGNDKVEYKLIIKLSYEPLPTPTSPSSSIILADGNVRTVNQNSPLIKKRNKRETELSKDDTKTDVVNITLYLNKENNPENRPVNHFKCTVDNITLTEGNNVITKVTSPKLIDDITCSADLLAGLTDLTDWDVTSINDKKKLFVYTKTTIVTKSLAGQWNCTVLSYKGPDKLPSNMQPQFNVSGFFYLYTNCYLNITVRDAPTTTSTTTQTTSTTTQTTSTTTQTTSTTTIPTSTTTISTSTTTTPSTTTTAVTSTSTTSGSTVTSSTSSTTTSNTVYTISSYSGNSSYTNNVERRGRMCTKNCKTIKGNHNTSANNKLTTKITPAKDKSPKLKHTTKLPANSSKIITYTSSSSNTSSKSRIKNTKGQSKLVQGTTTFPTTTTIATTNPGDEGTTETDADSDKEQEALKPHDPDITMIIVYGVVGLILFIVLVVVSTVVRKTCKQAKEEERQAISNQYMYDNLSNDNTQQFPPGVENIYGVPYDTLTRSNDDSEVSPYAVANYQDNNETYSVPYVEKDLAKLYAKPVPKSQRKELLYSKVMPKSLRKQDSPYAEIQPKEKQITYAEIEATSSGRNVLKSVEPTYSEVMPGYVNVKGKESNDYKNVVPEGSRYANAKDTEYAEPAYCELIKKNPGNRRK